MIELTDLVRDSLWLVVLWSLPFVAAGLIAGVLASLLASLAGLQDTMVVTALRIAAVLAAVVVLGPRVAREVQSLTVTAWEDLGRYGRTP